MSLVASDVKLSPDLEASLGQIGTNRTRTIKGNYGTAAAQAGSDASARGFSGPGSYNTERLGTSQGLDEGDLESVLGGVLGNTSYQDKLAQRDYDQQMLLADKVGSAAGLSSLEQVLGGIGAATKTGAALAPYAHKRNPPTTTTDPGASTYSVDPYSYGGAYSYEDPYAYPLGYGYDPNQDLAGEY